MRGGTVMYDICFYNLICYLLIQLCPHLIVSYLSIYKLYIQVSQHCPSYPCLQQLDSILSDSENSPEDDMFMDALRYVYMSFFLSFFLSSTSPITSCTCLGLVLVSLVVSLPQPSPNA